MEVAPVESASTDRSSRQPSTHSVQEIVMFNKRSKRIGVSKGLVLGLIAAASGLTSMAVTAQTRFVFVNGQRMSDEQIMMLQYFHCAFIPNGWYWANLANGAWGYVGNWQVQGYFGDQCNLPGNGAARQQRESLSQRGLLYSPHEIISGRP